MNIAHLKLFIYGLILILNAVNVYGQNRPVYCWDPTQTIARTDGATLTFGAPGQITCPPSAVSCATLVGVGLGTCSLLNPLQSNTQFVCTTSGCNQISSCWNPAASTTADALISCPVPTLSVQTYACFTSQSGVGSCWTSSSFNSLGFYCFSNLCNVGDYVLVETGHMRNLISTAAKTTFPSFLFLLNIIGLNLIFML